MAKPQLNNRTQTLPTIVHAFGGSIGSALSLFLLYPLERARIERQVSLATTDGEKDENVEKEHNSEDSSAEMSPIQNISQTNESQSTLLLPLQQSNVSSASKQVQDPPLISTQPIQNTPADNKNSNAEEKSLKEETKSIKSSSSSKWSELTSLGGTNTSYVDIGHDQYLSSSSSSSSTSSSILYEQNHVHREVVQQQESLLKSTSTSNTSKAPSNISNSLNVSVIKNESTQSLLNLLLELYQRGELYRGVKPIVTTLAISNFVFFYAHDYIKKKLFHSIKQSHPPSRNSTLTTTPVSMWKSLFASSLAGIINVLVTNPLWVANLRIVQQGKNGKVTPNSNEETESTLLETIRLILKTEGIASLWSGTFASLLLVSNPAIQHFVYEQCRLVVLTWKKQHTERRSLQNQFNIVTPLEAFLLGAIAKAIATVFTYPLQLTQVLLRLQRSNTEKKANIKKDESQHPICSNKTSTEYENTIDCLLKLYSRNGGVNAWFSGMQAKLIQTVLTSAFTFLTYEQILKIVARAYFTFRTTAVQ